MKSELVFVILLSVGLGLASKSVGICKKTVLQKKEVLQNGVKKIKYIPRKMKSCCEGYTRLNKRCVPQCEDLCINSICSSPNKCTCKKGYKRMNAHRCIPICDNCENGFCSKPGFCDCYSGYEKDPSTNECVTGILTSSTTISTAINPTTILSVSYLETRSQNTSSTIYAIPGVSPNLSSTSLPTTHVPPVKDTPIVKPLPITNEPTIKLITIVSSLPTIHESAVKDTPIVTSLPAPHKPTVKSIATSLPTTHGPTVKDTPIATSLPTTHGPTIKNTPIVTSLPTTQKPTVKDTPIVMSLPTTHEPTVKDTPIETALPTIHELAVKDTPFVKSMPTTHEATVKDTPIVTSLPITHEPTVKDTPFITSLPTSRKATVKVSEAPQTTAELNLVPKATSQSTDNQELSSSKANTSQEFAQTEDSTIATFSYQPTMTQNDLKVAHTPIGHLENLVTILSQGTTTTDESFDISTEPVDSVPIKISVTNKFIELFDWTTQQSSEEIAEVNKTKSSKETNDVDISIRPRIGPLKDGNNGTDFPNQSVEKQDIPSPRLTSMIELYAIYLLLTVMVTVFIVFTIRYFTNKCAGGKEYNIAQLEKKKGVAKYLAEKDELTTIW